MGDRSVRPSLCGELRSLPERLARPSRRVSSLRVDVRHFARRSVTDVYQHFGDFAPFERADFFL
jgi:hypothetical protein